jgi:hypothetical protein
MMSIPRLARLVPNSRLGNHGGHLPIVGLLIAASLIWVNVNTHSIVSRFLRTRLMRLLGKLSFGIYMWYPLVRPMIQAMDAHYVATMPAARLAGVNLLFVLYLSLTVACAGLSYFMVEGPVLRWKERFAGHTGSNRPNRAQDEGRGPYLCVSRRGSGGGVRYIAFGPTAAFRAVRCGFAARNRAAGFVLGRTSWIKPARTSRTSPIDRGTEGLHEHDACEMEPLKDIEQYELEITELRPESAVFAHVVGAPGANNSYGVGNIY